VPNPPPQGWHALTGWGQIYCEEGKPVVAGNFAIKNQQSWIRKKDGTWVKSQDQATNKLYGSSYAGDFSGSATKWTPIDDPSDGSQYGPTPVASRNVHWYHNDRGSFDEGTVDAVFSCADCKVSNSSMNYIVNMGADWWENQSATMDVNPGAGMANWVKLTSEYRTCYFMSISEEEMRANPPPPLK
jgi:hypothetical protein